MRQQLDALDRVLARAHYGLGLARERRQLVEVLLDVEIGILFLGDQQRAARQWHRLLRRQLRKFPSRVIHMRSCIRFVTVLLCGNALTSALAQFVSSAAAASRRTAVSRSRSARSSAWRAGLPPICPSAHAACERINGSDSVCSERASGGTASGLCVLPSATATLRNSPRRLARLTALTVKRSPNCSSSSASSSGKRGRRASTSSSAAESGFHGQTSLQMSQPKIQLPIF